MSGVTFVGVEKSERRNGFFRIRIQLHCDLEFTLGFLQIIVQAIEPAEQEVVVHIIGFDLDDFFVLLDSQLENVLGSIAIARHIAERPEINPAQQLVSFKIVRIPLQNVLGLDDGVANASSLDVEFRKTRSQKFGRWIGVDGEAVFFHGLVGQFASAVSGDLFFVKVRQRVVVIGSGMVYFVWRCLRRLRVLRFRFGSR